MTNESSLLNPHTQNKQKPASAINPTAFLTLIQSFWENAVVVKIHIVHCISWLQSIKIAQTSAFGIYCLLQTLIDEWKD